MKSALKKMIFALPAKSRFKLLRSLLSEASYEEKAELGIQNLQSALSQAKRIGFNPSAVIDIGAHTGNWTEEIKPLFPDILYLLIEPLPDKQPILKKKFEGTNTVIYNVLLGNEEKAEVPFYSMESGSSVMEELTDFPREVIHLEMRTLDNLIKEHEIGTIVLFKIDVQGFELEVLKGAVETLKKVEMVCMEVSLLNYNKNAPLIDEIIPAMKEYGFIPYDFIGFFRKNVDSALIQTDMLFVKESSPLRKETNRFDYDNFQVVKK